ncbi:alanine racemase [Carnobacteriaceae bacterium zg-C25]|nr:alanine racemase [Carnobacteriaceae bacterium zg-C25]
MVVGHNRAVAAHINLEHISHNIQLIKENYLTTQQFFAVVKADAYGHGAIAVSKHIEAQVDGFCVALFDEALELRQSGIAKPILVLGHVDRHVIQACIENDISITFSDIEFLKTVYALNVKGQLKVHVAVNTGMNRIGVDTIEQLQSIEQYLQERQEQFLFEGIFTHFATADGEDDNKVNKQYELFDRFVSSLNVKPRFVHLANSAMTLWRGHFPSDIMRVGIAMYGLNPSDFVLDMPLPLKPAFTLTAQIVHVHELKKGESVSYGAKYIAKANEIVATLPIGYADGWRRAYGQVGVYLNGQKCDVLGVICMDQMMIRVPKGTQVGDVVELIGTHQTASDVAVSVGTIGYEVLCGISNRVVRQYD